MNNKMQSDQAQYELEYNTLYEMYEQDTQAAVYDVMEYMTTQDEIKFQLKAYDEKLIEGDDLRQAIEEILNKQ
tara:strand:+ start:909 stop:1127 length:219 start_codon:yes stop_codon:yes gene_type:complete